MRICNANRELSQLRARINKLKSWIKEEVLNIEPPTLADVIQNMISRQENVAISNRYQTINNLKAAAKTLNFLTGNKINDMAGLEKKVKDMYNKQSVIRNKLTPIERRLKDVNEHIRQADIYLATKGKKPRTEAEDILFAAANNYLKGVMNGKTTLPTKAWRAERDKLIAERNGLNRDYIALKDEVREVEQIRRNVYGFLKQEQSEQNRQRSQDKAL